MAPDESVRLHHVRDVSFGGGASRLRIGRRSQPGCGVLFSGFRVGHERGRFETLLLDDVLVLIEFTMDNLISQSIVNDFPKQPPLLVPFMPGANEPVEMATVSLSDQLSAGIPDQNRPIFQSLNKGPQLLPSIFPKQNSLSGK